MSEQPQEQEARQIAIQCWNIRNKPDAKKQFEKLINVALAEANDWAQYERTRNAMLRRELAAEKQATSNAFEKGYDQGHKDATAANQEDNISLRNRIVELDQQLAAERDRYQDTEADGIVFCGKCWRRL